MTSKKKHDPKLDYDPATSDGSPESSRVLHAALVKLLERLEPRATDIANDIVDSILRNDDAAFERVLAGPKSDPWLSANEIIALVLLAARHGATLAEAAERLIRERAAKKGHKDDADAKRMVLEWYAEHRGEFNNNKEDAADAATKIVPYARGTIRRWLQGA